MVPFSNGVTESQMEICLWKYIQSEGGYRNTVVHGATNQDMANKIKETTANKVRDLYSTFQTKPNFSQQCHHYLFTTCTLPQRL
jgi:hypothetical protein